VREEGHVHRSCESDDETGGPPFQVGEDRDCSLDGPQQEPTADGREGDAEGEEEK